MKTVFYSLLSGLFILGIVSMTSLSKIASGTPQLVNTGISKDSTMLFPTIPEHLYDSIFTSNIRYFSDGFDFPVGKPDGEHYYKANDFGQKDHLGEDWNGINGGNTDLGDPAYSIGNGLVTFSENVCCGWGNVIRIIHRLPDHPKYEYVESVYAHLDQRTVTAGDLIERGDLVGTIGNADGKYSAHLHLEIRTFINMSLGPGYSKDHFGYAAPSEFIGQNRPE